MEVSPLSYLGFLQWLLELAPTSLQGQWHVSPPNSAFSDVPLVLDISHGVTIYTIKIGKCYKSGIFVCVCFFSREPAVKTFTSTPLASSLL